jgi:single-strand DNA-binding protein
MFQSVTLVGFLGADPELKYIPNGSAVASLNIATSKSIYQKKEDTYKNETQWHNVKVWGKLGESVNKFLHKGSRVFVTGELKYSSYEKDGVKKYFTEIVAQTLRFLDPKPNAQKGTSFAPEKDLKVSKDMSFTSDDIPF